MTPDVHPRMLERARAFIVSDLEALAGMHFAAGDYGLGTWFEDRAYYVADLDRATLLAAMDDLASLVEASILQAPVRGSA